MGFRLQLATTQRKAGGYAAEGSVTKTFRTGVRSTGMGGGGRTTRWVQSGIMMVMRGGGGRRGNLQGGRLQRVVACSVGSFSFVDVHKKKPKFYETGEKRFKEAGRNNG